MSYPPTPEQQEAIDLFATGEDLAIEAGAGTGKTSTLLFLAASAPLRRGQYVAFNNAIVKEAGAKFPATVACSTAHSLAMRAVGAPFRGRLGSPRMRSADIAARLKITEPLELRVQDGERKRLSVGRLAGIAMRGIVNFCQSADLEPGGEHIPYINGIDIPPGAMENNEILRAHLDMAVKRAWYDVTKPNGSLPYRHDHYLKLWHLSEPHIHADYILFDECQDANPVLMAIVSAQDHAQKVWVGDTQQQIYGFTGAVNALEQIKALGGSTAFLTQSFRFGPAVADRANEVLAEIGAELRVKGYEPIPSTVSPITDPDAILCRTNASAFREVMEAKAAGRIPYLVGGGDELMRFAKGAHELIEKGWTPHPELACFDSWWEVQEYVEQDEQGGELRLMVQLVEDFGAETIMETLGRMGKKAPANVDVTVSTAHKAKGREWDSVRLAPDFPDPAEREPGKREDELRLLYVAVTRAKLALDVSAVPFWKDDDDAAIIAEAEAEVSAAEAEILLPGLRRALEASGGRSIEIANEIDRLERALGRKEVR